MLGLTIKILFISWTIAAKSTNEFEEPEDARSVPPKGKSFEIPLPETTPTPAEGEFLGLSQQPEERTSAPSVGDAENSALFHRSGNHVSAQSVLEELKADTALLLRKMKACRKSHFGKNNQTFTIQLYSSLLSGLIGDENKESKAALRHCNISEELVDKLKAELPQLEVFQGFFVMVPKNNSSGSANLRKSTQEPSPSASGAQFHGSIQPTALENNLKLRIGDEWIPIKPKVSHLSHIYLGSSVYPILTEESRVLDKEQTIAGPTPTKESFAADSERPLDSLSAPPMPPKEEEVSSQSELGRSRIPSRFARSLQKKVVKAMKSESEEIIKRHEYVDSITDAPQRVYLLPRSSYVWKDGDMDTHCPVHLKQYSEDPRYQILYRLCYVILENLKKFFQTEMLKQKINNKG